MKRLARILIGSLLLSVIVFPSFGEHAHAMSGEERIITHDSYSIESHDDKHHQLVVQDVVLNIQEKHFHHVHDISQHLFGEKQFPIKYSNTKIAFWQKYVKNSTIDHNILSNNRAEMSHHELTLLSTKTVIMRI